MRPSRAKHKERIVGLLKQDARSAGRPPSEPYLETLSDSVAQRESGNYVMQYRCPLGDLRHGANVAQRPAFER